MPNTDLVSVLCDVINCKKFLKTTYDQKFMNDEGSFLIANLSLGTWSALLRCPENPSAQKTAAESFSHSRFSGPLTMAFLPAFPLAYRSLTDEQRDVADEFHELGCSVPGHIAT